MTGIAAALILAQTPTKVDVPTLEFYQGKFVVRTRTQNLFVPIVPPKPEPKMSAPFRRNDDFAVWDERGLTVRHGDRTRSSRLEDVPVSDRLFDREEIKQTVRLIHAGKRTKGATALSGAVRFGKDAYFLIRWEDAGHRPWAEFLVRVPLDGKDVWPQIVGSFEGMSLGYKPIDDRLFLVGGSLAVVTRQEKVWGLSTFDPKTKKFAFQPMGDELVSFMSTGRKTALYVERTAYGLTQCGRVDLATGERAPVFEAHGNARFLDTEKPYIVIASNADLTRVHNAETGAECMLPANSGVSRAGDYVLVWTPHDDPKSAIIYRPDRWKAVASWKAQ